GGEHAGAAEAARAAQQAGDALLEQQPLDELGLALVLGTRHLDEPAFGVLGLDLARAALAGARRGDLRAAVHQRHAAALAEALAGTIGAPAVRAHQRQVPVRARPLLRMPAPRHHRAGASATATSRTSSPSIR